MSPIWTFFTGCVLLALFAWYIFSDNDRARRIIGTILTLLLVAFCLQAVFPAFDQKDATGQHVIKPGKIRLGLDLQGGTSFLIQLMPPEVEAGASAKPDGQKTPGRGISKDMIEQAMEAIRKRVDTFGVSEPIITPEGTDRILVQIPGLDAENIQAAKEQLQKVAKLEFRLVSPQSGQILTGQAPPDPAYIKLKEKSTRDGKPFESDIMVHKKPDLTGDKVTGAFAAYGQKGSEVRLEFNGAGAKQFGDLTQANVGRQFAIVVDNEVISAPVIQDAIMGGSCVITGTFTDKEARSLASALQNPLQTPVRLLEQRSASSTLGEAAIHSGVYAGIGGLLLVLIFVSVYYRFAGLVAIVGLLVNIVILFGCLALFGSVLTLPGIAGVILTIGLAVDANVLIYERLREELAAGKSLPAAIDSAYGKAFTVIFDANATTLITAAILFWRATGPVKGFAVTLTIGVIASVFSAMIVTRVIFSWALHFGHLKRVVMMHIIPTGRNFNFLGKAKLWVGASVTVIIISVVGFIVRYPANLGIDFKGGDLLTLSSAVPVSEVQVREALAPLHIGEVMVQKEKSIDHEFLSIRSPDNTSDAIEKRLKEAMPDAGFRQDQKEHVGKIVGDELMKGSIVALCLGMLGILIYVTMRFELSFAIGALVALLHDVLITIGLFSLAGRELSLVMVGAILTIAGYSINDTIVVYDRIREGLKSGRKGTIQEIMNASINETLSRTLLTSGCTFLSVAALFVFGGPVLHDFAFSMLIGIIVGTYSSIFIASPIVLWWTGHKGQTLRSEIAGTGPGAGPSLRQSPA